MNAPLTRRALLGATAAVGAAALPSTILTSAHVVPTLDTDATLLDLIARHAKATASWEAACHDLEAARDRAWADHPPRPTALTATSADVMLYGLAPSGRSHRPDGRAWVYFNLDDLERLRIAGPVTSDVLDEDRESVRPVPNPAGEARRREIVDTFDRWLAERAAVDQHVGLKTAEAAEEPLCTAMEAAEAAVESYTPTTLAGMRAKAVWALARCDRDDAVLLFMRQIAGEAPPAGDLEVAA